MQAPTLFVIAADLTKMQVNANIDEADVGRIRPGQHVTFHVDAYPTETFEGTVSQIRLQPVVVQNVTTYGTVIDVPNPQMKLKPGMTANVKVEIAKRTNVLRVPSAALRFRPTAEVFAALNQTPPEVTSGGRAGRGGGTGSAPSSSSPETGGGSGRSGERDPARSMERFKAMSPEEQQQFIARMKERGRDTSAFEPLAGGRGGTPASGAAKALKAKPGAPAPTETIDALFAPLPVTESRGRAWLFMNRQLKPVDMRLGVSDGTNTELLSPDLQDGTLLATGVSGLGTTRAVPTQGGSGNPLMPSGRGPGGRGR
jgi:HlyD family secretion protein